MTSFAFILGTAPLWVATGSGGASRRVLGTVVITGMLAATAIAIFVIPMLFVLMEQVASRFTRQARDSGPAPAPLKGEA
jgi:HAE1 family hydrophobic/amphiphilic exporter-1